MVNRRHQRTWCAGPWTRSVQVCSVIALAAAAAAGIVVSFSGTRHHEPFERDHGRHLILADSQSTHVGSLPRVQALATPLSLGQATESSKNSLPAAHGGATVWTFQPDTQSNQGPAPAPSPALASAPSPAQAGTLFSVSDTAVDPNALHFVHIPLNGGEAIEQLSKRRGLNWILPRERSWPFQEEAVIMGEGYPCSRRDVPPSALPAARPKQRSFCVQRDPYDRMVEEFRRVASGRPKIFVAFDECFEGLNTFVHESLKWMLPDTSRPAQPYSLACQFLPQTAYIYGWGVDTKQVDVRQRWCSKTLPFERLLQEANAFLEQNGFPHLVQEDQPAPPHACPILNKWSLSPNSRRLIEQAFAEDFRLLGYAKMSFMEFIHIPRSGGSAVEEAGKKFYYWGSLNEQVQGLKRIGKGACQGQHTPPSHLPAPFTGVETFCIIRDVYNKMVSQFRLLVVDTNNGHSLYECTKEDLNRFIFDFLAGAHKSFPYGSDCHFLPQGAYVYSWDAEKERVDTSKQWCKHVVQYERLLEDVNSLFRSRGYQIRLKKQTFGTGGRGCELKSRDVTLESQRLINSTYKEDLEMLERIRRQPPSWSAPSAPLTPAEDMPILWTGGEGPNAQPTTLTPPPVRLILTSEQDVRAGTLVVSDLVTTADFELAFSLRPRSATGAGGMPSILRITATNNNVGAAEDRMPLICFAPRSTTLEVFMGSTSCHGRRALPLGQTADVTVRLQEDTLTVLVNGAEECRGSGHRAKYRPLENVKVWIGDKFHDGPDAVISNVVYKALLPGTASRQSVSASAKKELALISIPLNGGRIIEELSSEGELGWGHRHTHLGGQTAVYDHGYPCSLPSVPPSLVRWAYKSRETFCVVRDPYERIVAEFQRSLDQELSEGDGSAAGGRGGDGPLAAAECSRRLDAFVHSNLLRVLGDPKHAARPYISDCRFLPQAAYVYGWHPKAEQVDHRERSCAHVLHHAGLPQSLNELLRSHGFPRELTATMQPLQTSRSCPGLGKSSLNRTSLLLVERVFRDDFRLLGYRRLSGRLPGVRTILAQGRDVATGAAAGTGTGAGAVTTGPLVLVRDLLTSSDFRLAFEVTQVQPARAESGLFVLEGGGKRLLACSLQPDTRLACKAGRPAGEDFGCQVAQGLTLSVKTRVEVSLWGEELRVVAGGLGGCRVGGFQQKHPGVSSASFRLGDASLPPAQAILANVHYRVQQEEPEMAAWGAPRPPSMRQLISAPMRCEHNKLVADDVETAEEFELDFDIVARPKHGVEGMLNGIVLFTTTGLHYGHMGDRMPALFFVGGSTRIIAYMGHPNHHNAECSATNEGLAVGKKAHVTARLVGNAFRLFVNGKESCFVDGYTAKYSAMTKVKVFLADRYSDPANAQVSNLVYRVAGMSEELELWSPQAQVLAEEAPSQDSAAASALQPAPPQRAGSAWSLLTKATEVKEGNLLEEAFVSAQDFELSFDLTPTGVKEGMSSILTISATGQHYGHAGDRMPAVLFSSGSTRLMVYMGHEGEHNAACETPPPGLPQHQTSHVQLRLSGDEFTVGVSLEGKEEGGCTMSGYYDKYPKMSGVQVWLGDTFNGAAKATVANLVYKAI